MMVSCYQVGKKGNIVNTMTDLEQLLHKTTYTADPLINCHLKYIHKTTYTADPLINCHLKYIHKTTYTADTLINYHLRNIYK
jgi:uncharacterized protein (DUF2132 family)